MRSRHPVIAAVLIGLIILGWFVRIPASQNPSDLTPGEESEARALADDFIARLEEQPDLEPLIRDFFITDFAERLRTLGKAISSPFATIDENLVKHLGEDELRRLYAQTTLATYFMARYAGAATYLKKRSGLMDDDFDLDFLQVLPPDVIAFLKSDPTLVEILGPLEPPGNDNTEVGTTGSSEVRDNLPTPDPEPQKTIETREYLERYLAALERLNSLMKQSIKSVPSLNSLATVSRDEDQESEEELNPQATLLSREWFGFPEGTRIICSMALVFHMDLVKEHGKLKIVSLYLAID